MNRRKHKGRNHHLKMIALAIYALFLTGSLHAQTTLYGVTGDGATIPEALFVLDQSNGSASFVMSLGNGDDGEAIAFNPDDRLMYHASGIGNGTNPKTWEAIDLDLMVIVASGVRFGFDASEVLGMTYDPMRGTFLVSDRQANLVSVTLAGEGTRLGELGQDGRAGQNDTKGLAFRGNTLYGVEVFFPFLHTIETSGPSVGAFTSTSVVTLPGYTVHRINGLATNPDDNTLWALLTLFNPGGQSSRALVTLDHTNGVATLVGFTGDNFAGIAFVPAAVPSLTCVGFEPPMDGGPVKVKKNRVLPLKAQLIDENSQPINDLDITAPPVIQVMFVAGVLPAVDVTSAALSAGAGTAGNQFEFLGSKWQFNLKTKNYTAAGTYTTTMESGDEAEYLIDPTCEATFVIN